MYIAFKCVYEVIVVDQQLYNVRKFLFTEGKKMLSKCCLLCSTYHATRPPSWNLPMMPFGFEVYGISQVFRFQIS